MLHVVLYEPEIPPNTGNIIRLCANTGTHLHLIHPMGFSLDEKQVRRAGLDYHALANVSEYPNYDDFLTEAKPQRLFACSTKAQNRYSDAQFQPNDFIMFGPESRGLPDHVRNGLPTDALLRIPMQPHSRSLNLSNATAIILLEAWRQLDFNFPS